MGGCIQSAADCYEEAIAVEKEGYHKAAECCMKAAKARENQVEALIANNQTVAELQKKIAELLGRDSGGSAFYYYKQAGWADNRVQAQSYREQAQEKEAEVARLQENSDALLKNH